MKNPQNPFIVPLIIAAVVVIGGGIYYSKHKSQPVPVTETSATDQSTMPVLTNNATTSSQTTPKPTLGLGTTPPKAKASATIVASSVVKAYNNKQYGFTLQYPDNWTVNDQSLTVQGKPAVTVLVASPLHPNLVGTQSGVYFLNMTVDSKGVETIDAEKSGFFKFPLASNGGLVPVDMTPDALHATSEYKQAQAIFKSFVYSGPNLTSGGSVPLIVYISGDKNLSTQANGNIRPNENGYIQGSNFGTCAQRTSIGCEVAVYIDGKPMTIVSSTANLIVFKVPSVELGVRQMYVKNVATSQNSNPIAVRATQ